MTSTGDFLTRSHFSAPKAAYYETLWWRAHGERRQLAMLARLTQFLHTIYTIGPAGALNRVRFLRHAASAHDRRDREHAVAWVLRFYASLLKDPHRSQDAARLAAEHEVGWWWAHDTDGASALNHSLVHHLSKLYGCLYALPTDRLHPIVLMRIEAIRAHDLAETDTSIAAEHWRRARQRLEDFYMSLGST